MGVILFSKGNEGNWCFILLWAIHQKISTSFKDQNKLHCQQCHIPHRPATGISPRECLPQGTLRDAHQHYTEIKVQAFSLKQQEKIPV